MGSTRNFIVRGLQWAALLLLSAAPAATLATHLPGHVVWNDTVNGCKQAGCHGATANPQANQLNAAGTTATVLNYIIANQVNMMGNAPVNALTAQQRLDVATYVLSVLPAIAPTTPFNTAVQVDVGSHLHLTGVAFTSVQTVTGPSNGTLSAWSGASPYATVATYTPNAGFVGTDSFTYRGTGGVTGTSRTINITVNPPPIPVITSANTKSGTVGISLSYTITATNSPTSFNATSLPSGIARSGAVLSGPPTTAGTFNTTSITATNAGGTSTPVTLTFTIAKGSQTITFPAQTTTSRAWSSGGSFSVAPLAGSSAGLTVSYGSATPSVCTASGTSGLVSILTAGVCTITANQAGDANYNAATQQTQNVTINAISPGAPTIGTGTAGPSQASITFTAPTSNGGSPITGYKATCNPGAITGTSASSPVVVTGLTDGTPYSCSVQALTAAFPAGGAASSTVNATPITFFNLAVTKDGTGTGTVTSSPGTISCGGVCNLDFVKDTSVTLTATADVFSQFTGWSGACAGTGTCNVTMQGIRNVGATFTAVGTLLNISTRMQVLTGNDVMIGGFVISGSTNKTVVVRARGPSLIPFGITNALANPTLRLVQSSDQSTIAVNDDWQSAANSAAVSASGFAPGNNLESAILINLPPGAYTAIVSGVGGGTGVGIVEVFEVDHPEVPLANISTRGQVLTGNDVMIGGFVIQGSGPQTVVIRARGPSLIPFGITNALANPTLQLVRSSDQALLDANDNWQTHPNQAALSASGYAPSNPLESAILTTLQPGAYTVIVSGVGGTTGVAIVEVFAQ